ncbi:hypothetical protein AQJ30_15680 [Streptomyces longwoodensis]|uniref:Uncharacterized protein n=1 Tax=Streptomyces longwoodensis TaxID=68231 RepID=A0A124HR85_9ACTN|nr:hypothetical protein [Streptomyces longwoodensis]KUN37723.1 hypothetical protein AQJ30_15680 [Streptomyces longwoodensis]
MFDLVSTTVFAALTEAGMAGHWHDDEQLIVAYPASVSPAEALDREHIVIDWTGTAPDSVEFSADAWEPDGRPDFTQTGTAYATPVPRALDLEAVQCAKAVAEWFADPVVTAGQVLLEALAVHGLTAYTDDVGMSYAIALEDGVAPDRVRDGLHLSVGDRSPSIDRMPSAHTGWTVCVHDHNGEPVGGPVFSTGDGGLVDCAADSAAAARAIADRVRAHRQRPATRPLDPKNPRDRAEIVEHLELELTGGCGFCDLEADMMCAGCGRCNCHRHDDCVRPASQ